jgi:hypothetical protein
MVRQEFGMVDRAVTGQTLDPVRGRQVATGALGSGQAVIRRVAHERVDEGVLLGRPDGRPTGRPHDVASDEPLEAAVRLAGRQPVDRDDGISPEHLADDAALDADSRRSHGIASSREAMTAWIDSGSST